MNTIIQETPASTAVPKKPASQPAYFSVWDLHAYYGESYIVQGVSFNVHEGEILALLGRNGAGKTSTLRAIARLDERLLRMAPSRRNGLVERIALSITSDALWAEGTRLRPEHLALADRDRIGRSEDEDQIIARATWADERPSIDPVSSPREITKWGSWVRSSKSAPT